MCTSVVVLILVGWVVVVTFPCERMVQRHTAEGLGEQRG